MIELVDLLAAIWGEFSEAGLLCEDFGCFHHFLVPGLSQYQSLIAVLAVLIGLVLKELFCLFDGVEERIDLILAGFCMVEDSVFPAPVILCLGSPIRDQFLIPYLLLIGLIDGFPVVCVGEVAEQVVLEFVLCVDEQPVRFLVVDVIPFLDVFVDKFGWIFDSVSPLEFEHVSFSGQFSFN